MKDNRDILNEAFFKKATYAEKQAKRLPQYSPLDPKLPANNQGAIPAFSVTDTNEVKKRLASTFGVTFGNNNIKSLASRALKTFPIIVSDNLEPETVVMLKRLMEEQYAEYINLLVSNQVVNLADYTAGDENGNIAIQALDNLSGTDFSKTRVANTAARTGSLSSDSIFQNVPLYQLLREEKKVAPMGDTILDSLFEGALVVPTEYSNQLVSYIQENMDIILNEDPRDPPGKPTPKNREEKFEYGRETKLKYYLMGDKYQKDEDQDDNIFTSEKNIDLRRGFQGVDDKGEEIYTRITTGDIVIDRKRMDQAINRSIGQILCDPANVEIRDRFEKATFLLQSRRISGREYIAYLTLRLGIPVSDKARQELVNNFKVSNVRRNSVDEISIEEYRDIVKNRVHISKAVRNITSSTYKDAALGTSLVAAGTGAGAAIGAGAGAIGTGTGLLSASSISAFIGASPLLTFLTGPIGIGLLAGAAVGGAGFLLYKLAKKRRVEQAKRKIEGWEVVEALIKKMEEQQASIRAELKAAEMERKELYQTKDLSLNRRNSQKITNDKIEQHYEPVKDDYEENMSNYQLQRDYVQAYDNARREYAKFLAESVADTRDNQTFSGFRKDLLNENYIENSIEDIVSVSEEASQDKDLCLQLLTEDITSTVPMTVKYVEQKPGKDVMITPSFMARDEFAYGTTEIMRKENKDRRFNQPLIMTIKFKERFDSDNYTDNELTAVIGILGKVIRVPTEEMEYILKENLEGNTIEGFLKGSKDLSNTISSMLSTSKISNDIKNLPQSADVWRNLEKVATLAAANTISGKRNNNIANAHIVFSQKEIDDVRLDKGVDYLKDAKKAGLLMKRYSAFTLMVGNDAGQRLYILDDFDNVSWEVVPYSALAGKDTGDQLAAALSKLATYR